MDLFARSISKPKREGAPANAPVACTECSAVKNALGSPSSARNVAQRSSGDVVGYRSRNTLNKSRRDVAFSNSAMKKRSSGSLMLPRHELSDAVRECSAKQRSRFSASDPCCFRIAVRTGSRISGRSSCSASSRQIANTRGKSSCATPRHQTSIASAGDNRPRTLIRRLANRYAAVLGENLSCSGDSRRIHVILGLRPRFAVGTDHQCH